MPAISLLLLGAAIGLLLSWSAARPASRALNPERSTSIWVIVLYALLVHAPATTYLLVYNPDWSFAYHLAPSELRNVIIATLGLANAWAVPFGFLLGGIWARRGRLMLLVGGGSALGVLIIINSLLFLPRLLVDASFVEYKNQFGLRGIAGSALGYSLIWVMLVLGVAIVWTHGALCRINRELTSPPTTGSSGETMQ